MNAWKLRSGKLLLAGVMALPFTGGPSEPPSREVWKRLDEVLGREGRDLPGDVRRYGWPRTDLAVAVRGVPVEPALALSSWAAFKPASAGAAEAMGDLVLLGSEVNPVVTSLQSSGIEILAIHNHLIDETPRLIYLHFCGRGDPTTLGRGLKAALGKTGTPPSASPGSPGPTPEEQKTFEAIQSVLGRKGSVSGRVLQVSVPRAERIEEQGMEVPPAMGMATALNFQSNGSRAAATGDFVLLAEDVNPVVKELQAHGIDVTALHSHMLREQPRLFFLHFWGVGEPEEIAAGLKAALSRIRTQP